jgi:RNA polymerase sigma-70 factor, ECF subfamily
MDTERFFRDAVEENKDRIYRICCCYALNAEERQDLYQDTLIHIWKGLKTFREGAAVSSWVYRVAVNTCLDHVRAGARQRRVLGTRVAGDAGEALDNLPTRAPAPEDDRLHSLYAAIDRLSLADRTLISLYLEDLDGAAMAEVTGLSEANVRVRIHRIKNALRSILNEANHGTR